jgi:hypothetical protein
VHSFASSSRRAQPSFRSRTSSSVTPSLSQPVASPSDTSEVDREAFFEPITTTASTDENRDVFMSVYVSRDKLGCAVYEFASGRLSLLEDSPLQTRPSMILQRDEDNEAEDTSQSSAEDLQRVRSQSIDIITSGEFSMQKRHRYT